MLRRLMVASSGSVPDGNVDNFDVDSLSQYVQYSTSPVTYSISGGALTANGATGSQSVLTRTSAGTFLDGEISCVLRQANDAGLALRVTDANNYILAAIYDSSGTSPNRVVLYRRSGGVFSQISTATISFPRGSPNQFSFSMLGTAAIVKMNGVQVISATVTTNTSPGLCGMRANAGTQIFEQFSWP